MKKLVVSLFSCVLFGCASDPEARVLDHRTTISETIKATSLITKDHDTAHFWAQIANNPIYSKSKRTFAVLQIFAKHCRPGSKLSELAMRLEGAAWLEEGSVYQLRALGGDIPIEFSRINNVFSINLCRGVVIWINFDREATEEVVSKRLKNLGTMLEPDPIILQVASSEYIQNGPIVTNAWGLNPATVRCE